MPVVCPALRALSMSDPVRVGVIDHGSGNLHSAERALRQAGAEVTVSNDPDALLDTDALVLPGVGALAACMAGLRVMGGHCLVHEWVDEGRPLLGICVGHKCSSSADVNATLTSSVLVFSLASLRSCRQSDCPIWDGTR